MTNLNFVEYRPRVQIIRGLPGTGKSTLAKQYPCLHLELDHFCCRGGAYRWGEQRDREACKWLSILVHRLMKEGMDLVIAGVMPTYLHTFGHIVYWAMKCGYDVWVQDLTEIKGNGNVHNVRQDDLDRMQRAFQPYDQERLANIDRYSHDPLSIRLSANEHEQFSEFVRHHVNNGLMPKVFPNLPEIDGLGV